VRLDAFSISRAPVGQGEFAAFVDDGGYERREWWSDEGWRWREAERALAPRYWRREAGQWTVRRFDRWEDIDASAPMMHVTRHEALAYCRWAGRRLPTESEWEFAARNAGSPDRFPWGDAPPREGAATLDLSHWGPSARLPDPAPSRSGLRLLMGGVWEWTASDFAPYPGFAADPYTDYSQPWFHSHGVLRGGCFATRARLVHNRFRNFYLPERADIFAGFRTCAVDAR
jgi:ergothioneine biosynthesis protein EgtB